MRVHNVAQLLDCSRKNVYNMIRDGKLEAVRLGPRQIRVPRQAVEELLNKAREDSLSPSE